MAAHYINNRRIFLMRDLLKEIKKYKVELKSLPITEILNTKEYNTILNLLPTEKTKEKCFLYNHSSRGHLHSQWAYRNGTYNNYLIYNDTIIGIYLELSKNDDYFYITLSLGYDNESTEIYDEHIEWEYYRCDQLKELKIFLIKIREWYLLELGT